MKYNKILSSFIEYIDYDYFDLLIIKTEYFNLSLIFYKKNNKLAFYFNFSVKKKIWAVAALNHVINKELQNDSFILAKNAQVALMQPSHNNLSPWSRDEDISRNHSFIKTN